MQKRLDPANAANIKRQAISKRKQEAEENEDFEEAARCDAELAALENNASTNSPLKPKTSPIKAVHTSQENLAAINQKNRSKNADDVRRALLEERKKFHRGRERALAEAKAAKAEAERLEAEKKRAENLLGVPGADLSELFGSDISRGGTPVSGISTPMRRSRAGTPLNGIKKEKSGLSMVVGKKKKQQAEDELSGLGLDIDVEI